VTDWESGCCGTWSRSWRLEAVLLDSDLKRGAVGKLVGVSFCGREWPLAGVGGSDGTGFSNRSFDVVRTGGAGGTSVEFKRLGLACVIFEACGVAIEAEAGSSFSDRPFMYCDMSLAMLCCKKSSLR
jgi:hypothetical protein